MEARNDRVDIHRALADHGLAGQRGVAQYVLMAEEGAGIYEPRRHLELVRDILEQQGKDPDAFVRFHVRRLEALRRAGHVERIDADHWRVPHDVVHRGMAYDLSRGGDGLRVRVLSTLGLEQQIASDGATWLDRELVGRGSNAAVVGWGLAER